MDKPSQKVRQTPQKTSIKSKNLETPILKKEQNNTQISNSSFPRKIETPIKNESVLKTPIKIKEINDVIKPPSQPSTQEKFT